MAWAISWRERNPLEIMHAVATALAPAGLALRSIRVRCPLLVGDAVPTKPSCTSKFAEFFFLQGAGGC